MKAIFQGLFSLVKRPRLFRQIVGRFFFRYSLLLAKHSLTVKIINRLFSVFFDLRIYKVQWLESNKQFIVKNLVESGHSFTYSPNFNMNEKKVALRYPEVNLFCFHNVVVTKGNSSIYRSGCVIIERHAEFSSDVADYKGGSLIAHDDLHAWVKEVKPTRELIQGIYIGYNGFLNYYHWMVEILPRLMLLKKEQVELIKNFYVPEEVFKIPQLIESLAVVERHLNIKFERVEESHLAFKNLYFINCPHVLPYNVRTKKIRPEYSAFNYEVIASFRHVIMKSLPLDSTFKKEKIFLCRRNKNRSYNQDQIEKALRKLGFRSIYLEDYSVAEQAAIFNQATVIVGPTGASWTNLIFSQPGQIALCWMSEAVGEFSVFSSLAKKFGCELHYLQHTSFGVSHYSANYTLSEKSLIEKLAAIKATSEIKP